MPMSLSQCVLQCDFVCGFGSLVCACPRCVEVVCAQCFFSSFSCAASSWLSQYAASRPMLWALNTESPAKQITKCFERSHDHTLASHHEPPPTLPRMILPCAFLLHSSSPRNLKAMPLTLHHSRFPLHCNLCYASQLSHTSPVPQ